MHDTAAMDYDEETSEANKTMPTAHIITSPLLL